LSEHALRRGQKTVCGEAAGGAGLKKKKRAVFAVLACVLMAALAAACVCTYRTRYRKTLIAEYSSPDGIYSLSVWNVGEPRFPFGPGRCRVVLSCDGRQVAAEEVVLYNDGKWPDGDNFTAQWAENSVSVTVRAEEMEDAVLVLEY